jgi:hypothetical protein
MKALQPYVSNLMRPINTEMEEHRQQLRLKSILYVHLGKCTLMPRSKGKYKTPFFLVPNLFSNEETHFRENDARKFGQHSHSTWLYSHNLRLFFSVSHVSQLHYATSMARILNAKKTRQNNAKKATESRKVMMEEVPDTGDTTASQPPAAPSHDHADPTHSWHSCKESRDVTSQTPQPLHQKGAMISSAYHAAGGIYTR